MKKNKLFHLGTLAAGLLCLGLMFGSAVSAADDNPCAKDAAQFCKDIKPGMAALMDCLESHESMLSPACRDYESKMLGTRTEKSETARQKVNFRRSCMSDIAKFCNDADPARGGLLKCLNDHKNDLSAACGDSVNALQ